MLDDIVKAHKPHPKSLKNEASEEAYNEEDARQAFGDEFIDQLKKNQRWFKGDWWQLALLVRNLDEDEQNRQIEDKDRHGAWNKWGREQPGAVSSVYERIHLERATLREGHLEYAFLPDAHLEHANLWGSHLEHAILLGAHLEHANLRWVHLEHAILDSAHLEHAILRSSRLEHAHLKSSRLEHANLSSSRLEHADLTHAHLQHADLLNADLKGADVREAEGLRFDGNQVEGIRIEGNAPDPWSVLRRQYTGPWFFVHLLLLAIFFAPYVGHALYLTAKSQFQEWSREQYNALAQRAADVPGLSEVHAELQRRFFEEHEQRRAVWVLLGVHRGFLPFALAAIVVLYNAVRGFLTLRVSLLRDAEERSNITPLWKEYERLHTMHSVARILLWVALTAVAYNTCAWAYTTWIWVPVGP